MSEIQNEVPQITSTANHIQLLQFRPEEFAGLDNTRNLVLFLNEAPIIGAEGDQGVGKTSFLNCLIALLGGDEAANSLHTSKDADGKTSKSRKAMLTFKDTRKPNISYEVRMSKSSIIVKKLEDADGTILPSTVDKPKTFLADTFGPIGITPMVLKEKDGKKQIDWIRSLYKFTPDQLKQELILSTQYQEKFKKRTAVNNDVKRLKGEVLNTGYYSFDKENFVFVVTSSYVTDTDFIKANSADEKEIEEKFQKAHEKMQSLTAANTKLENRKREQQDIEREITDLEQKLLAKKNDLLAAQEKVKLGEQYIKELETAPKEFEEAKLSMQNVGDVKLKKQNIGSAENKVKEYVKSEDEQTTLNSDLDELKLKKKNFIKQFTPDIPGLELVVNEGIDTAITKEDGLYLNDRTPAELSESELWDLFMQICRAVGVHFLFIENLNSLGTAAIDRLNWFVKEGFGQVFYTAMSRGQKEMKVTFHTELK